MKMSWLGRRAISGKGSKQWGGDAVLLLELQQAIRNTVGADVVGSVVKWIWT